MAIGQPVNLIYGLKYGVSTSDLFYPPTSPNIFTNPDDITKQVDISTEFDAFPILTFCDDFAQLVQAFFDYINPDDQFKAGGFMFQPGKEQETASDLADLIGIHSDDANLTGGSTSFVLARQWKQMTNFTISGEPHLDDTINETLQNIEPFDNAKILSFFSSVGTHFVIGYTVGDFVYQAFAYEQSDYQMIKERYPTEESRTGFSVLFSFPKYTEVKGDYEGYAKYYGPVKIASANPDFETEIVPYLEDSGNVVDQSIFRLSANESVFDRLNQLDTSLIAKVQLRSLEAFADLTVSIKWLELLRSSSFQKFGSIAGPSFSSINLSVNYAEAYSQFAPLYPTLTASYLLGMKYLYMDLSSVQVLEPDKVKTMFLLANVIELSSDVFLPGDTSVIIICDVFVSKMHGDYVPTLTVNVSTTDDSSSFILISNIFYGTMKLKSAVDGSHSTIYDGNALILTDSGIDDIKTVELGATYTDLVPNKTTASFLYEDTGQVFNNPWVISSFSEGLGYFIVCIENILNYNMGKDGPLAAFDFSRWIVDSLSETVNETLSEQSLTSDDAPINSLTNIYSRALVLRNTRNPQRSHRAVFVPYLAYKMYEDVINTLVGAAEEYGNMMDRVQQQIDQQRMEEEIAENQEILNQNIHNIAKFLISQNKAAQQQENNLSNYYGDVVDDKQNSLNQALKQQNNLLVQLNKQAYTLQVEEQKLEEAMKNKVAEDLFNAAVNVAMTCVDLFTDQEFKIPEDLKGLITAVTKVKKTIQAIEAFAKLLEGALSGPPAINSALDSLKNLPYKDEASVYPTELDWIAFDHDVGIQMSRVPVPEAANFEREAKMYSAIGRQYTATSEQICQLQYAIATNAMQKYIHSDQAKRLDELDKQMSQTDLPTEEAMNTDLFQLGTFLQSSQDRILIRIMDVMQDQDGALQYYTLQKPTPLTRYDILSVKDAIASRAVKALNAFSQFSPPPHELEELRNITISYVPFDALIGAGYDVQIKLSKKTFYPYVRVRVTEVQAYIDYIQTNGNQLYVKVTAGDSLIHDRGLDRETLNFSTYPHVYPFVYEIDTGAIVEGNRITGEDLETYNLLTPFTKWTIQTPPDAMENEGIHNLSTVMSVQLHFRVNVIRHDANSVETDFLTEHYSTAWSDVDDEETDTYNETELVSIMSGAPMTYGWDVVSCVDAEKITELFKEMYDEEQSGLVYHIHTTSTSQNTSTYYAGTEFDGTVGPPLISFINNQPNMANLTMVFVEGAVVEAAYGFDNSTGSVISNDTTVTSFSDGKLTTTHVFTVEGNVVSNTTNTTSVPESPKIEGLMQLSKLTGVVTNQHDVIINLGKGVFDVKFSMNPDIDDTLNDAIRDYFRTELADYNYTLGTVKFNTDNTPPALQPTLFLFSTSVPKGSSSGVLLMFIKTNASDSDPGQQEDLKLSANPLPINRTSTLIISNKVLMEHFVLPEIQKQLTNAASASSSRPYDDPYVINGSGTINVGKISVSTNGFQMSVAKEGYKLRLSWNENWSQEYTYKHLVCCAACDPQDSNCQWVYDKASMPMSIAANDEAPLKVSLDPDSSVITFEPFDAPVEVKFSPPKKGGWQKFVEAMGGDVASDMTQEGQEVGDSLKNNLKEIHVDMLNVSVFAVSNLLFPGKKVMNLETIYLAQDLVLFGDVNLDYKP